MTYRIKITFLLLIITQGIHSSEEYIYKLWEVLYPARLISSLVSENLKTGFLIVNIGIFLLGILSWLFISFKHNLLAYILVWFWVTLELINGIGHPMLALSTKGYFPGLVSSFILLLLDIYLIKQLLYEKE